MLPQRLIDDVRTRSQRGFLDSFNPVHQAIGHQGSQLMKQINQHQTINHQIMIQEFDKKLNKPKVSVSPKKNQKKKNKWGKIEVTLSDSKPSQEVQQHGMQKQTIYIRDPSRGRENCRVQDRFQGQDAFAAIPDLLGRTDTTFYNDADRQSNRSNTQEAKQCQSTSSHPRGAPPIIQKYDSVYLEPLNPGYSGTRTSQQVFSSNAEDMHEKACGPAEDNTDFSKEEFVVETDGLVDMYTNQTPPLPGGQQAEKTDLVDIYSKKTEAKNADKSRALAQKRNYDLQSSLNMADEPSKKALKSDATGKHKVVRRSFGATKGQTGDGTIFIQPTDEAKPPVFQHEALYTLSQNSIGYEAGSVELCEKDVPLADNQSKHSMQHSIEISKFRSKKHSLKNKAKSRKPKRSVVKLKERLLQHDKTENSAEAKESYGPFAQKQLDLIKQESTSERSRVGTIFQHLQSQSQIEENDYTSLTHITTASPFIPGQTPTHQPNAQPAPDIDELLKSVTSSFKARRQTEYKLKQKVEEGLPKLAQSGRFPVDDLTNVLDCIRNKSRDVSRGEQLSTRSGFQQKLEQFVKETRSEIKKQVKEMNCTFQDWQSTKIKDYLKPQTPIFSQRLAEMGRTFQSGKSNQIKLLPVLPDQGLRIQSPGAYRQQAHTPSSISNISQRQMYLNAQLKPELSQQSARGHLGLDDRVTRLLQAGQQKINQQEQKMNQQRRAVSIKPKRPAQLVQPTGNQRINSYVAKIQLMQAKAARSRAKAGDIQAEVPAEWLQGANATISEVSQVFSPWDSSQLHGPGSQPAVTRKREHHISATPGASGPQVLTKQRFELARTPVVQQQLSSGNHSNKLHPTQTPRLTEQSQTAPDKDTDPHQSDLSHYRYNIILPHNSNTKNMKQTLSIPSKTTTQYQFKEETPLQRKKKSLDKYLQTPIYHNILSSNIRARGSTQCNSQGTSPKPKKRSSPIMLQISARQANHENNLHQRYPSALFSNIGLLNPNSYNNHEIFMHILKAKEQEKDYDAQQAQDSGAKTSQQRAMPAPFQGGQQSPQGTTEQYSPEFSQASMASPGLETTQLGFKFNQESPSPSALPGGNQSGSLVMNNYDTPYGKGNLILNSKSGLDNKNKLKGTLSLVPLAEVPDKSMFFWHDCSPLFKIGISKDQRFNRTLVQNKFNRIKQVKIKPQPADMSGLVDHIANILNAEHKKQKNAELVKFLDNDTSRAEIVLSNRFIKQMRVAQNREQDRQNSFSIDPTLVESMESINSDLIEVEDRKVTEQSLPEERKQELEHAEGVTFSPGQLSSPTSLKQRPGVEKRPSKTVVFMKQDHNPPSQRTPQRQSGIQSFEKISKPLDVHEEQMNEADSGASSPGASSPIKRPVSQLET